MTFNTRAAELMVQGRDLPWLLDQWVQRTPEKTFLIWATKKSEPETWSYGRFEADVRAVAGGLAARGLAKGQRLLVHMENCPELLITHFACAYLGAVAVHTNTRLTSRELIDLIALTEIEAIVTQPQYAELLQDSSQTLKIVTDNDSGEQPDTGANLTGYQPFAELLKSEPFQILRPAEPLLDLRVQFTSGTTSQPKAVLSTHANVLFAAQQTAKAYELNSHDVAHVFVPLFHTNGLTVMVMGSLWVGGTVLLQRKFSASNFWAPAIAHRATWCSLPGGFFINALSQYPVPEHLFRFWFIAVLPEVEAHFKVKTRGHWGMTEMITLPIIGDAHHEGPPLNIGRPAPGTEIAIRRADGSDSQPGETGDLFVRGVRGITIFKQYLNNPTANAEAFDDQGWFNTGDRIRIDQQGNLFFADRSKDMLRVGGENIAASEIEAVIRESPWVKECAVVGQPHKMLDEVPVAFVSIIDAGDSVDTMPDDLEDQLIGLCKQHLADFKVIRRVYIVEEFPRASLNKIAKYRLREGLPTLE